ncbi:reticulon-like protein B14 [Amaranthus tricolor]|uniref:reticulon-like protein B14 n=1 Tax=Amaranthus tricolor TaxID=29722 RepID=UPI00259122DF|nr:reticulon-like protein B14 [Amaranthus tricolor]
MPIYSDFNEQASGSSQPSMFFRRNKPLHSYLGGRKVADVLLWRNKALTTTILAGFSMIWFLFVVVEIHFITVLCYLLMTFMLILFISIQGATFFKWRVPTINDIQVSETTARYIQSRINYLLTIFYRISCGQESARFFGALASLWLLSILGSYSSALNVLYVGFLCLITIPVLYEQYEREVTYIATQGKRDMKRIYNKLDSKFISKIPRGPVKEKKYM